MTRVDTYPNPVTIKRANQASYLRFLSLIAIAVTCTVTYFLVTSQDSLGDPSDEFVVKNIPKYYTNLEVLDPDDRDVFTGFKTSYLPHDEAVLTTGDSSNVFEGNVTSDILIWDNSKKKVGEPTRVKRMSHFSFTSLHHKPLHDKKKDEGAAEDYSLDDPESEFDDEYETNYSSSDQNRDDESFESVVRPEPHVDRGPLDDVVEQVRGQPELEEEEMGSSAHLYKPAKSTTAIHAFWKGQGDRQTIRETQAHIMKQYMDAGADPCHDFYQYACGNWPALNPIPADKAGYDTFEMLRENLDTVLKDLLEIKSNEEVRSTYPGSHLDLNDNFLRHSLVNFYKFQYTSDKLEADLQNETRRLGYDSHERTERSEIIRRTRRYLDQKPKGIMVPINKLNYKFHNIINHSKKLRKNKKPGMVTSKRMVKKLLNKPHRKKKSVRIKRYIFKVYNSSLAVNRGRKLLMNRPSKRITRHVHLKNPFLSQTKKILPNVQLVKNYKRKNDEDPAHGDATIKARFLFKSCMNYDILQKRGHQPLLDLLNILGGWPILDKQWNSSCFDWLGLMASLRLYNNDILISEWVGPDIKNSDEFVIQFDQTSLGLPTRDYFLQESNKVYLDAYKKYLVTIALLLGGDPKYVKRSADELIEFEKRLARITSAPEDRRNVSELYRRMSLRKLEELVPEVDWRRYLCIVMNRTVKSEETVVLFALTYIRHLVKLIDDTESSTLSNYLLWRFVRHRVNNLDDRFQSAKQQFYYILFGREQAPPRWKNCVSQVNSNMGMALGSMFVRKYFDETSKNDTLTMTREIQQSFRELLHTTDWIDADTKKLAAHKVDAMMLRIGYPDFIRHEKELDDRYKEVKIYPDKYFENILNILQHLTKMEQSRIGQPVNKTLWNTAPAVVNAYYSRNKNQIMFPAGILQPPFYHRHFPRSLNYGGIGVVIGHEITHGFDDKGRLFDRDGNLHRWWSDAAIQVFHSRAQCLIEQYGKYVVPEVNMNLDGINTQGENIADNGGVKQAFRAYLRWLKNHGSEGETLPGLNHTHTQLFFLNFAQVWCGAMRPEAMRNKLKTAVHAPGRFRVIGTLSNSRDFAREFNCPPDSPMNPTNKCSVW